MKIRTKLYLAFASMVILAVVVQAVLIINLAGVRSSLESFNAVDAKLLELADDMRYYDVTLTDAVRAILIDPTNQSIRDSYDHDLTILDSEVQQAEAMVTADEDHQLFQQLSQVVSDLAVIEIGILENPRIEDAPDLYSGDYGDLKTQYSQLVRTFYNRQSANFDQRQQEINNNITLVQTISIGLAIGLAALAIFLAVFLSRSISIALNALMKAALAVSDGDMTARATLTSKDEL